MKLLRIGMACNQHCLFCNVSPEKDRCLKPSEVVALLQQTKNNYISFTGGEPTLSKELPAFIYAAKKNKNKVEIQTNAVKLSRPEYVRMLVEAGVDQLFVSLHSDDSAVSDRITGYSGAYVKTIQGIETALQMGVKVRINHVINSLNYQAILRFVTFVEKKFVSHPNFMDIQFSFIQPNGSALEHSDIIPLYTDVKSHINEAMAYCIKKNIVFCNPQCGFPFCMIDEAYIPYSSEFQLREQDKDEKNISDKMHAPQCASCVYIGICRGVWKGYAEVHGLMELAPYAEGKAVV